MSNTVSSTCNVSLQSLIQESGICFRFPDPSNPDVINARNKCYCNQIDTNSLLDSCANDDPAQWYPTFQSYLKGRVDACKNVSISTDAIVTGLPTKTATTNIVQSVTYTAPVITTSTPYTLPLTDACAISQQSLVQEAGICYRFPDPSVTDLEVARDTCFCNIDTNAVLKKCASYDASLWNPAFESYLKGRLTACQNVGLSTDGVSLGLPVYTTQVITAIPTAPSTTDVTKSRTVSVSAPSSTSASVSAKSAGDSGASIHGTLFVALTLATFLF
ncbi:hypothetical protein BCR33DRAFT_723432 [Rhizoclosmatium globosum]|uniref:Uncharacterized protein n=1 Tax=Rhizoclosmatium globosum TaxID=329046 RepID=A0A1Y2BC34_9FUNG|nr:hypothetical protein BCR33DRAFT_723432 [Rhizoclosmatium globosum]|eukprot:ORY32391.1 hypothetical protein BCR33DRAFT_723432 [Rhizoclosmatium globosum]